MQNAEYILNTEEDSRVIDIILGHKFFLFKHYEGNHLMLKGGWYEKNIDGQISIIKNIIEEHCIEEINFVGASKSCSGAVRLTKYLHKEYPNIKYHLFLFSAYTTVNKEVYIRRKLMDYVPRSLEKLWESSYYNTKLIQDFEHRKLINKQNINIYYFFPSKSKYGENILALRVQGDNITHISLPVFMHNTIYPFWKTVKEDATIELYENEIKTMHPKDYQFYHAMQTYKKYDFTLYNCIRNTKLFMNNLFILLSNY